MTCIDLAAARKDAAARYQRLGESLVLACGVGVLPATRLAGWAVPDRRVIRAPWPATTRQRLYIVAHECGHVVLHGRGRGRRLAKYVVEYEAERFAIMMLRKLGVPVPKAQLARARRYVAAKTERAIDRGAYEIAGEILRFAGCGIVFRPWRRLPASKRPLARPVIEATVIEIASKVVCDEVLFALEQVASEKELAS